MARLKAGKYIFASPSDSGRSDCLQPLLCKTRDTFLHPNLKVDFLSTNLRLALACRSRKFFSYSRNLSPSAARDLNARLRAKGCPVVTHSTDKQSSWKQVQRVESLNLIINSSYPWRKADLQESHPSKYQSTAESSLNQCQDKSKILCKVVHNQLP